MRTAWRRRRKRDGWAASQWYYSCPNVTMAGRSPKCALSGCGDQGAAQCSQGPLDPRRWTARPPPLRCPVGWAWARALARHDGSGGGPSRLRLSAQIPAGGRQRRGPRRSWRPAGRCGRVPYGHPAGESRAGKERRWSAQGAARKGRRREAGPGGRVQGREREKEVESAGSCEEG